MGFLADIHGNDVALRAVLTDAASEQVDQWWALGDLVLFGPRPAEVLELLLGQPGISLLRGNTDRYVLTGEQPAPHATAADAAASIDLVERFGAMAAGIGWTRGVLDQAGLLDSLEALPAQLRVELPSGAVVLGVHASPGADDGPGIEPDVPDERLRELLAGCGADIVVGGHTHVATDRLVDKIRALNPGSAGLPRTSGTAGWLLVEDDEDTLNVTLRATPFDVDAVASDLHGRRHPNAGFVSSVLPATAGTKAGAAATQTAAWLSEFRQPALDEAPFGAVVSELSRPLIGVTRLVGPPETPQELGPGRVQVAEVIEAELVDYAQARRRALVLGDGDGPIELHDRRAGQASELAVKPGDLRPVAGHLGVQRRDGGLQDIRSATQQGERTVQLDASGGDLPGVPA